MIIVLVSAKTPVNKKYNGCNSFASVEPKTGLILSTGRDTWLLCKLIQQFAVVCNPLHFQFTMPAPGIAGATRNVHLLNRI
jgi:hypothetical protein